jgi:AcrR family transcriptional regulator
VSRTQRGDVGKRGPGERAGLTEARILQEARAIAERDGIERLSMRRLATELGVAPNALYSHFADKAALLDALYDSLLAEIEPAAPGALPPRAALRQLMVDSRQLLVSHAGFLPQLLSRPMRGPNASRLAESMLSDLARMGADDQAGVDALRVLLTYTFGSAALDAPRAADPLPERRWAESEAAFAAQTQLPHVTKQARALAVPPVDAVFLAGLDWLLDGIERAAGQRAR